MPALTSSIFKSQDFSHDHPPRGQSATVPAQYRNKCHRLPLTYFALQRRYLESFIRPSERGLLWLGAPPSATQLLFFFALYTRSGSSSSVCGPNFPLQLHIYPPQSIVHVCVAAVGVFRKRVKSWFVRTIERVSWSQHPTYIHRLQCKSRCCCRVLRRKKPNLDLPRLSIQIIRWCGADSFGGFSPVLTSCKDI